MVCAMTLSTRAHLAMLVASLAACTSTDDPTIDWSVGSGPAAQISGKAFVFGPANAASLAAATISVAEAPEFATPVAADGTFALNVPSGAPVSLLLQASGFHGTQTAALALDASGLDQVGFQVPTDSVFDLMSTFARITPDDHNCQIATTVSRKNTEPYGGSGLGEPGVIVTIDPQLPSKSGPIYFKYVSDATIYPDPILTETTIDGGVIFVNVPPGEYTLTATKADKAFTSVTIRCREGVLVNAAPPRGLQEL